MSPTQEDSTHNPAPELLLSELSALMNAHRHAFGQERVFRRAWGLLLGWLFAFSRKTMTQLLVALGWVCDDWSANYRLLSEGRLDYDRLTQTLFSETLRHVPEAEPYRTFVDATPILRHSKTMPGTFWGRAAGGLGFRPNVRRMQRFVNLAWLVPQENGYTRAIPLRWFSALPQKAVPAKGEPTRREWEAGLLALQWVRQRLDEAGRAKQWLMATADGSYDVNDIWIQLPKRTLLVVRCAKNRRLYELPKPKEGRGRKPTYGTQAPHPQEWLHRKGGWERATLEVRGKQRLVKYRVRGPYLVEGSGQQPVFLLVVKGHTIRNKAGRQVRYRPPSYSLVNALKREGQWVMPADAVELLTWAWQRWEGEVSHRELKSGFGVGQMQCWSQKGSLLAVQWAVWMYAVLVLSGYRAWSLCRGSLSPPPRWREPARRWSLNTLWQAYRQELWQPAEFQAVRCGSPSNWPEIPWLKQGLWNAARGSMRG